MGRGNTQQLTRAVEKVSWLGQVNSGQGQFTRSHEQSGKLACLLCLQLFLLSLFAFLKPYVSRSQLHYGECTTCRQHHYSMEHVPYLDSKATLWRGVYHAQAAMQGLNVCTKELSVKDQSLEKFNQGLQAFCLAARFPFFLLVDSLFLSLFLSRPQFKKFYLGFIFSLKLKLHGIGYAK